jgi:hypothetical protein
MSDRPSCGKCARCKGVGREPDRTIPGDKYETPCWFTFAWPKLPTLSFGVELTTRSGERAIFIEARKPFYSAPARLAVCLKGGEQALIDSEDVLVVHDGRRLDLERKEHVMVMFASMARDAELAQT